MSVYYSAAKINLFLQVEGLLPSGYHELTSVMQSVSLFDRVEVEFGCDRYALDCGGLSLGSEEKNIVTRMWRLLKKRFSLPGEAHIALEKHIPVGGGLAGGSGNGAAVLRAVMDAFALELSEAEIAGIAAEIGADVAFCCFGGTMLATGIGEKLERLPAMAPGAILLFDGGFHISTPEIFQAYDRIAGEVERASVSAMIEALKSGERDEIGAALFNGLEKAVYPDYASLKQLSETLGAREIPYLMSGSGPTVFALAEPKDVEYFTQGETERGAASFGRVIPVAPVSKGIFTEKEYIAWQKEHGCSCRR